MEVVQEFEVIQPSFEGRSRKRVCMFCRLPDDNHAEQSEK
ncbi:hypothetical protein SJ05684_a39870 (plasmid) [Sinorhizobium sojae CCBAU 05684]|uniref:Uncharacterized protein n=1 Tax=Sinorhizobium sojae CCBAU 05684 TaxID=716928 RepID=A0A249PN04_9HYPH|nr:hypothetical protein SJ05684_a39870 [Sinorhizobium sojae CCBAU 05684]